MKIDVFCGWGDGPDVGINIELTPEELAIWNQGLVPVDLTAAEARQMAQELMTYADEAEGLERSYEKYMTDEWEKQNAQED